MSDGKTKEQLRDERDYWREKAQKLEGAYNQIQDHLPQVNTKTTRRSVLGSIVGGVALYGVLGKASAQTTGTGEIASQANPALRVYVNRVHFVDLGSEPSSPGDGSMYYNSNA